MHIPGENMRELGEDFSDAIAKGPIIVDFWAEWCGPCKMMAQPFLELSEEYKGKLEFAKLNVDNFPEAAQEMGVQGIPCLIVFKKGEELGRIVGFMPKPVLKKKIDDVLGK